MASRAAGMGGPSFHLCTDEVGREKEKKSGKFSTKRNKKKRMKKEKGEKRPLTKKNKRFLNIKKDIIGVTNNLTALSYFKRDLSWASRRSSSVGHPFLHVFVVLLSVRLLGTLYLCL
jgi:hypothetical protein